MNSHQKVALLCGIAISAVSATGTSAFAQVSDSAVDEVVVTGSRVVTNGMQQPTPVTAVATADLSNSQPKSLVESLSQLPALSASLSPQQQGISTTGGTPGGSYLNLRNLNPVRTLVLVDGQRSVPTTGLGITDLAIFPTALIQRVDIVTGGASAAYGSDALAGVVNFILDTKYTGFKGEVMGTMSGHNDNEGGKLSLTYGSSQFGGRGHFVVSGEYYRNGGVPVAYNRDWGVRSIAPIANPTVTAANPATPSNPAQIVSANVRSAQATVGGLIATGPLKGTQFLPAGIPAPFAFGSLVSTATMSGGDGVDPNWSNSLTAAQKRQSLYTRYTYDVTDDFSVFGEAMYGHGHELFKSNIPYETANAFTIFRDNVFLPAATAAAMDAAKVTTFAMGRMDIDFSPTGSTMGDVDNTTKQFSAGANWHFGDWSLDAHATHGENEFDNKTTYDQNYLRLYQAADAIANPAVGGVAGVAVGAPICRYSLANPNSGCQPMNLFGNGSPSAQSLAYVVGTAYALQTTKQDDISLSISGKPFELWAGPVSLGGGVDYRKISSSQTNDADSATRFSPAGVNGVPASLTGAYGTWERSNPQAFSGSVDVKEAFAETLIPLMRDLPLAQSLDLNAAARYTDYSTSGGVTTWKVGLVYTPVDDVRFRATRSRDIRAPNIYELFSPFAQTQAGQSVVDPFQGNKTQTGVTVYGSGNPNLVPEEADTNTFGVVYKPSFIPGMDVSVDYYSIKIGGEIIQLGGQNILNQCFSGVTNLCPLIIRTNGNISIINNQYVNVASFETNGVDTEVDYNIRLADWVSSWNGSLRLRALAGYMGKYITVQPGSTIDNTGDSGNSTPKWQGVISATYKDGPFTAAVTERIIGSGKYNGALTDSQIDVNHVDGVSYTAVTASYKFGKQSGGQYELYGTINNLFDKDPPPRGNYSLSGVNPTNKTLFDVIGRDFTAGIRFSY